MPTGYTAGILDGKITTFPQFAKQCMRAFGATIHMRDDAMDAEYQERTPSDYHTKKIEEAQQSLKDVEVLSDEAIIAEAKKGFEESKKYHLESIEKAKKGGEKLNAILQEVNAWVPPTEDHAGIKTFMVDQIKQTIDFDCKTEYHDKKLIEIESELTWLSAKSIRADMIEQANKDLKYHTHENNKEITRCNESNKWVKDLLKSLK